MKTVQIIVPHDRRCQGVSIDAVRAVLISTLTPPGFGFDIETWQTSEPSPYPTGEKPEFVEISYKPR